MRNLYYIALEGPIGVGKTSLAQMLSRELSTRLVLEDFEDNPFLSDFYNDPERFAFQAQLFFLFQRYRQQQELRQWLKKVPDDPARLLRNKMFRAYQRNLKNLNTEIESW